MGTARLRADAATAGMLPQGTYCTDENRTLVAAGAKLCCDGWPPPSAARAAAIPLACWLHAGVPSSIARVRACMHVGVSLRSAATMPRCASRLSRAAAAAGATLHCPPTRATTGGDLRGGQQQLDGLLPSCHAPQALQASGGGAGCQSAQGDSADWRASAVPAAAAAAGGPTKSSNQQRRALHPPRGHVWQSDGRGRQGAAAPRRGLTSSARHPHQLRRRRTA
jgi:hypothetical protein